MDALKADGLLKPGSVDAVCLDVQRPSEVLEVAERLLKPFCPLVVYLPNITQIVELDYHVRVKNLLLDLEQVVQVDHKIWTVRPATSKHHLLSQDGNGKEGELGDAAREVVNNLHIPYVARPSHQQLPHTGFLARLLKRL